MNRRRFNQITSKYPDLRVAVVGDFCLDRYLEIDPRRAEVSIETGLPVHNVVSVRSQPGAAGTILNNLVALGVGKIFAVGFAGDDGEGYELRRALSALQGVNLDGFIESPLLRTFTYTKPLEVLPGKSPRELNRLDQKNWKPTPIGLQRELAAFVSWVSDKVDAVILMDQVAVAETGVVTSRVLRAVRAAASRHPELLIMADSRRSLHDYARVALKMNRAELIRMYPRKRLDSFAAMQHTIRSLAKSQNRSCFLTLAEAGILGCTAGGEVEIIPAFPIRGEIDVVGAGDAVTANLVTALASGANLKESLQIAAVAASIVIHQLGTTGSASVPQLRKGFQLGNQND